MIPHDTHLQIGSLLFEGVDQIDVTGPCEVLSRIPNTTYRIYGKTCAAVPDIRSLRLTPDAVLADAPPLDVLHVPGGDRLTWRETRVHWRTRQNVAAQDESHAGSRVKSHRE